jgi:hypothetical protein
MSRACSSFGLQRSRRVASARTGDLRNGHHCPSRRRAHHGPSRPAHLPALRNSPARRNPHHILAPSLLDSRRHRRCRGGTASTEPIRTRAHRCTPKCRWNVDRVLRCLLRPVRCERPHSDDVVPSGRARICGVLCGSPLPLGAGQHSAPRQPSGRSRSVAVARGSRPAVKRIRITYRDALLNLDEIYDLERGPRRCGAATWQCPQLHGGHV